MGAARDDTVSHGTAVGNRRAGARTSAGAPRPRFRRRSFLVNRRYQLRAAALVATLVLVLLVFLNLSLYSRTAAESERILRDSPELAGIVRAQDRAMVRLVVGGSLVFVVGVFVVSLLETHKTAGACVNVVRRMTDVRDGRYDTVLRLRRDDHLREIEPAFNAMADALRRTTWEELEALEEIAGRLERGGSGADLGRAASDLRALAARKRTRVEPA